MGKERRGRLETTAAIGGALGAEHLPQEMVQVAGVPLEDGDPRETSS